MAERAGIRGPRSCKMTAIDLRLLSHWINGFLAFDAPVTRATFARQDKTVLRLAEGLGILRNIGIAPDIACTVCPDDPHRCRVLRTSEGHYRIRCLDNGWIDVTPDEVTLLACDRQALLAGLAHAAGKKPGDVRLYANGRLARIGFVENRCGADGWMLGYADGLENENIWSGAVEALAREFARGPGLIATPSALPINLPLPNNYQLFALHDLVHGTGTELVVNYIAAEAQLGRRKKTPGHSGRSSEKATVRRIWVGSRHRHDWPAGRGAQVDMILSGWPSDGSRTPARGTIENHIREFEQEADIGSD